MTVYHFNIIDGVTLPDPDGVDLPNLEEARVQAVRLAGDLLRYSTNHFLRDGEWRLEVTDNTGLVLFVLYLTAIDAPAGQRGSNGH